MFRHGVVVQPTAGSMRKPTLSLADDVPRKADIVIVGGGMAGLEMARHLFDLSSDLKLLVVEAGPGADLVHINSSHDEQEAVRMWLEPSSDPNFSRPWATNWEPHYADK